MHPSIWEMYRHQVRRIQLEVDYYLTFLQRMLVSSDLNIWLACLLSSQRFVVQHPLCINDVTWQSGKKKILRTKEDMADHFGTAVFARILLWGYCLYISRDTRCVPPEYQKSLDNGKQKSEGLIALTNDIALPDVGSIQQMLQSSITRLKVPMFTLFQTILADFWALQSFAEPYGYEERLPKRPPLINVSTNDVDQTEEEEVSSHRKTVKSDMEMYRAAKQLLEKTHTSDNESSSPGTDVEESKNQLSTSSSSSSTSSSHVYQSSLTLEMISTSAIKTPREGKSGTMSFKEDTISKMEVNDETDTKKRKRDTSASTTNRNTRSNKNELDSRK